MVGCSESVDSCDRTFWYGTYDYVSGSCNDGSEAPFEDSIFLKEGTCENCLADMSSTEYQINEDCKVVHTTPLSWVITLELDGDLIRGTIMADTIECVATYKKRE